MLPISLALSIARQVAEALAALHVAGWLHGQVRPEHVMVSPQGRVTLLDLSRCRRLQTHECDTAGSLPAMLAYAAPEMFSAQRLGAAADVYSPGRGALRSFDRTAAFRRLIVARAGLPRIGVQASPECARFVRMRRSRRAS